MTDKTLTLAAALAGANIAGTDELWIWDVSAGQLKKTTRAELIGAVLTGDGTIVTGGFTLTIAASGVAALISTGTWTPVLTGSSSNPTVTYLAQSGRYTQIGDIVFFDLSIIINTISGGSGDVRVSLPLAAAAGRNTPVNIYSGGVDLAGTPVNVLGLVIASSTYAVIDSINDNSGVSRLQVSGLSASDAIQMSGLYFV